jgi:hypothetical protein
MTSFYVTNFICQVHVYIKKERLIIISTKQGFHATNVSSQLMPLTARALLCTLMKCQFAFKINQLVIVFCLGTNCPDKN